MRSYMEQRRQSLIEGEIMKDRETNDWPLKASEHSCTYVVMAGSPFAKRDVVLTEQQYEFAALAIKERDELKEEVVRIKAFTEEVETALNGWMQKLDGSIRHNMALTSELAELKEQNACLQQQIINHDKDVADQNRCWSDTYKELEKEMAELKARIAGGVRVRITNNKIPGWVSKNVTKEYPDNATLIMDKPEGEL